MVDGKVAWRPANARKPVHAAPLSPAEQLAADEEAAARRHQLASQAQARYEQWSADNPGPRHDDRARDRDARVGLRRSMSHALYATSADRIAAAANDVQRLKRPIYDGPGANTLGMFYSYYRRSNLLRQRMKGSELAGPMRFSAQTQSVRIMETKHSQAIPVLLEEDEAERLQREMRAMYRVNHKEKWLAKSDFSAGGKVSNERPFPSLATSQPYVDHISQDALCSLNKGHARVRNPAREVGPSNFRNVVPSNCYLPNMSKTCTWNILPEPGQELPKTYYRAGSAVPSQTLNQTQSGGTLLSASQVRGAADQQ